MTTLTDKIFNIADAVQNTFEELIKLVLSKDLLPTIKNAKKGNQKTVYNSVTKKYQREYNIVDPDKNIDKYYYRLTNKSLGWMGESFAFFEATPKMIKNRGLPKRFPSVNVRNLNMAPVAFSSTSNKLSGLLNNSYQNLSQVIHANNMLRSVTNLDGSAVYQSYVAFSDIWKLLVFVGEDIVDQTSPTVSNYLTARLSTSALRIKLYELEKSLCSFPSAALPDFISMIQLVNQLLPTEINTFIILLGTITYTPWANLSDAEKNAFIAKLGENFINSIVNNNTVIYLLSVESPELIIESSYLFPLMKMLFMVFGFDNISSSVATRNGETVMVNNYYQKNGETCSFNASHVEYLRIFCDLYPTLTSIMGGCSCAPCSTTTCSSIPTNFNDLTTIPTMLWRFYNYSYCLLLSNAAALQSSNTVAQKTSNKIKYLSSI